MSKDIRQTVTFNAKPGVIFAALMDAKKHAAFTGAPAKIGAKPGQAFSCYGGYISGINLEVVTNKSIVQAWRGKDWPKGAYSIASFTLASAKGGKTKLSFVHTGVPDSKAKGITAGWKSHYWEPLKASLQAAKTGGAKTAAKKAPARKAVAKKTAKKPAAKRPTARKTTARRPTARRRAA